MIAVCLILVCTSCAAALDINQDDDIIRNIANKYNVSVSEVFSKAMELEYQHKYTNWAEVVLNPKPTLLVIDMQNDFISGSLVVTGSTGIVIPIKNLMTDTMWYKVVFSQDWHPANHISFQSNWESRPLDPDWRASHPGDPAVFTEVVFARDPPYTQMLWPDHCIQGSGGAEFHSDFLPLASNISVVQKGINPELDSYSAFFDNTGTASGGTGLDTMLGDTTEVVVVGVATDFCVGSTVVDSLKHVGIPATLLTDLSKPVSADSEATMLARVRDNFGIVATQAEWEASSGSWQHALDLANYFKYYNSSPSFTSSCLVFVGSIVISLFEMISFFDMI